MQKKKIWLGVLTGVVGLCLVAFLFTTLNGFFGNPVSAGLATNKIRAYVAENYAEEDFQVPQATYNFKFGSYNASIQSGTSPDTHFSIEVLHSGKIYDSYSSDVIGRFNTLRRLETALNTVVEELIKKDYPHPTRLILATMKGSDVSMAQDLTLDMPFDVHNLPLPVELVVWTSADQPSYEIAAQRMLALKALMKTQGVDVSSYSLNLEYPYHTENGELRPDNFDSLSIQAFPADRLTDSPDLPQLLEAHQKARDLEGNKEKQAEIN
jgi:hypothetical protein